jgi:hypothetical protein
MHSQFVLPHSSAGYALIFYSALSYGDDDERREYQGVDRDVQTEVNHTVNSNTEKTRACAHTRCAAKRVLSLKTSPRAFD